jgi:hypothetical protein
MGLSRKLQKKFRRKVEAPGKDVIRFTKSDQSFAFTNHNHNIKIYHEQTKCSK